MKRKVVAFGEIVWDMLPDGKKIGGAPLNFAYFSQNPDTHVLIISAIGDDMLGRETVEILSNAGIDLTYVQKNSFPTSQVLVELDENGCPQYEIVENVAWDAVECTESTLESVSDAAVFCWGSLSQRNAVSRNTLLDILNALPADCLRVFDINIRQHYYTEEIITQSLSYSDVLKLNEDELPLVADILGISGSEKEIICTIMDRFSLKYLIYTHGAEFSEIHASDGEVSRIDTPKVEVKDTVGAGDSFTAAFVASLISGQPLAQSHARAVEVSALVCTKSGAIDVA